MNYIVDYVFGNDYYCGCCRKTWDKQEIKQFVSDEEAKNYADLYNKNAEEKDLDQRIASIYKLNKGNYLIY